MNLSKNIQDKIIEVSQGNPGCISIFLTILEKQLDVNMNDLLNKLIEKQLLGVECYTYWKINCNRDYNEFINIIK